MLMIEEFRFIKVYAPINYQVSYIIILLVRFLLSFTFLAITGLVEGGRTDWSLEKNASFWNEQARLAINDALARQHNTRTAKNIILFLGDGMGISTVTAGRIRKGQVNGQLGEDYVTEMEKFAHLGLSKT